MRYLMAALGAAAVALPVAVSATADTPVPPAAQSWLGLVDQGHYAESWSAASAYFKAHITEASWEQAVKAAREPLGALTGRVLQSEVPAKTLPGAPDGDYDVLQFRSQFAHKASAVETLTLMKEGGDWKVAGYFIR